MTMYLLKLYSRREIKKNSLIGLLLIFIFYLQPDSFNFFQWLQFNFTFSANDSCRNMSEDIEMVLVCKGNNKDILLTL